MKAIPVPEPEEGAGAAACSCRWFCRTNCCEFRCCLHGFHRRLSQRGSNVAEALVECAVISALHVSADAGDETADDQDAVPLDRMPVVATPLQPLTGLVLGAVTQWTAVDAAVGSGCLSNISST